MAICIDSIQRGAARSFR